jgi:hypothetical protein
MGIWNFKHTSLQRMMDQNWAFQAGEVGHFSYPDKPFTTRTVLPLMDGIARIISEVTTFSPTDTIAVWIWLRN